MVVRLVVDVAVGVLDSGSEQEEGNRGTRPVALVGLVLQESGYLAGVAVGVVGELLAGGDIGLCLRYGYTVVVDGLV